VDDTALITAAAALNAIPTSLPIPAALQQQAVGASTVPPAAPDDSAVATLRSGTSSGAAREAPQGIARTASGSGSHDGDAAPDTAPANTTTTTTTTVADVSDNPCL
jgi:hypothetical protein